LLLFLLRPFGQVLIAVIWVLYIGSGSHQIFLDRLGNQLFGICFPELSLTF
jgi:hypothetical protein